MKTGWFEAINSHIKALKADLNTSAPARVVNYYPDNLTIDAEIGINRVDKDGLIIKKQIIKGVPLMFPSAGGGFLTFPVKKGDTVLLVFSQSSMDDWLLSDGSPITPKLLREFSVNDAVAIIGLWPNGKLSDAGDANTEDVELKFNDNTIILRKDGSVDIKTKSTYTVSNDSEELIQVLSDALQAIIEITTNTTYGPTPINNKADFQSIKSRLDSFLKQ